MSVEVYNFVLCNNSLGLFGKFEQTILFCSLVQFAIFYCNPILFGPIALEIFPACRQPYQTLKSRRSRPLGELLHIKYQPLVSVQKEILRYLHYQISVFAKPNLASSLSSKENVIWKFWQPEEFFWCPWHYVEHLWCLLCFGMVLFLYYGFSFLMKPACPLSSYSLVALSC